MRIPPDRAAPSPPPAAERLVQDFESLGDNCEFGLVQRYCGAEPLGLFRFSSAPLEDLLHSLETDFSEYGGADDLAVLVAETGRLYCRSRRYGFAYNTSEFVETTEPASIHRREVAKVAYLKRRLLEDLAEGEKIFLRKGGPEEGPEQAAALTRALRRHGPATLLAVRAARPGEATGTAAWVRDGVMVGHVRRFAPYETAYDIDLESWLDLCRGAHALAKGTPAPASISRPPNLLARRLGLPARHVLGPPGETPNVFGRRERTDGLDTGAVHVFSAWVWIPAGFRGERVGAAIGHFRYGWCDADLSVREAWQRVWVAAKIPASYRDLVMGLVVTGPEGEHLWSTGRRLEAGPLPAPQPRPTWIGFGSGT